MRGAQFESQLQAALEEAGRALASTHATLRETLARQDGFERSLGDALHRIAEQRLAAAGRSETLHALGALDQDLAVVAARRRERSVALVSARELARQDSAEATRRVGEADSRAAAARQQADQLRAAALAEFHATAEAVEWLAAFNLADREGEGAERAHAEACTKHEAFVASLQHPVHLYLRERRYATPDYSAAWLPRLLDAAAARASRYAEAHLREQLLLGAIDARAAELAHAEAQFESAEAALHSAAEAFIATTAAAPAEADAEREASALERCRSALSAAVSRVDGLDAEIAAIESGRDEDAVHAHARIVSELMRLGAAARAEAVKDTAAAGDDRAHAEASALEDALRVAAAEAARLGAEADAQAQAVERIQQLRTEAARRGWSGADSEFRGLDLGALLIDLMTARVSVVDATRTVERSHRVIRPTTAASHWAGGGARWGSGRAGGFGGGSRSSGGGFGGGGRRTGGGF